MVDAGQGFAVPRGIEENPYSIGHPSGGRDASPSEFLIGEDVPSSASALGLKSEYFFPKFGGRDRAHCQSYQLGVPVVDVGVLRNGDAAGLRRAVAAHVAAACATYGFFQVSSHGVDDALARAALDSASGFFRLPLAEKQRARRVPGTVSGYMSAHADRFASKLPWKETLSFGFHDPADAGAAPVVVDYLTSTLGEDFEPMGNYMDDMDDLRDAFSLFAESAGLDKGSFMYDGEIKSRLSAMRANGMSLAMSPTPITGRSSANSREDLSLYLDSGASRNVVFNPALLINPRDPPAGTEHFRGADGSTMAVIGYGDIEMENFRIPDVYLVQGLTINLISVGQLASSHKVCCCFVGNECNLMLSDGRQIGGAIRGDDNQYMLRFLEIE